MKAVQVILLFCLLVTLNSTMSDFLFCMIGNQEILKICNELFAKIKAQEDAGSILKFLVPYLATLAQQLKACFDKIY